MGPGRKIVPYGTKMTKAVFQGLIERLRFTFIANGKRQTQVENFAEQKINR